jgi:uncharacterized protein (TIGR00369 family)
MILEDDGFCFACGEKNPIGLKLKFEYDENSVKMRFTPGKEHQGWSNVIHGGILTTLLDEAMAKLIINEGHFAVTSSMEIKFLRPAQVGEELLVYGEIIDIEGRNIHASSKITNSKGKTVATGKGIYVEMKTE